MFKYYDEPNGLKSTDGYEQMSIVVEMDKEKDFIHAQSETYPFSSLMSDIGGAAGLFLGLSVVAIGFKPISKIVPFGQKLVKFNFWALFTA